MHADAESGGQEQPVVPDFEGTELEEDPLAVPVKVVVHHIFSGAETSALRSELGGIGGVAVDLNRIEGPGLLFESELDRSPSLGEGDRTVEARPIAYVAARIAHYVHAEPQGILVIVDTELDHLLHESAGGPFSPQRLPTATEVVSDGNAGGKHWIFLHVVLDI